MRTHDVGENVKSLSIDFRDQLGRIPLFPLLNATSEISAKRLLSPRGASGVTDGSESGGGTESVGRVESSEIDGESAVTSHGVTKDGGPVQIEG